MRRDALPLTYDECRARFRRTAARRGHRVDARPIEARGPDGQVLTIDIVQVGAEHPERALIVLSGVHGVEGFVASTAQTAFLEHLDPARLPDDVAVLVVHAVNPWGMAWWRRQNESNVDLNRNWARDSVEPPANPGYDEVHDLLCPTSDELPDPSSFLDPIRAFVDRHGVDWVRHAVSAGQYTRPDGLYFGGDRTEQSTRIVAAEVGARLVGVTTSVAVDLHTGHGEYGAPTILADQPVGSSAHAWLCRHFEPAIIETTIGPDAGTSAAKVGQIGHGLADVLPGSDHHSFSFEIGTAGNTRMILAERAEHWVHRFGDRQRADHASVIWDHRTLSTPDDPEWETSALAHAARVLDAALVAVTG